MEIKKFEQAHPLQNNHIVEIIFQHCDIRTLSICRLVCQTWNYEARRILDRNEFCRAFVKGGEMSDFLNCMKTSENGHPFSSFVIQLPAKAFDEEFEITRNLILLLKDRMRHVKFEYENPKLHRTQEDDLLEDLEEGGGEEVIDVVDSEEIQEQITLPNLTSLHIFSTNIFPPKFSNRLPKLFDQLCTPRVSSLSIQHLYATECASTVVKYLSNSQISSLRMPCTEFLQLEKCSVRLGWLRELDICDIFHGSFAKNETLQCIRENCPNLQSLAIELGIRVTFNAVFKLFETLSHSLVNLKVLIQDKNLLSRNVQRVNFYFPHMPKLQSLFLRYTNPGMVYYIDEMPQLTSLELETPWTRKVRGHLFPGVETKLYDKVQNLSVSEKLTTQDVEVIQRLFPNLKTLSSSFNSNEAFAKACHNFGERLESLIVDRNSSVGDCGICDITDEQLLQLSEVTVSDYKGKCIGRGQKSVAHLKRLKCLKFMQLGISWKSIIFGVAHMTNLQSLTVQATTLKLGGTELHKDDRVLQNLVHLTNLRNISVWIRKNSERFTPQEMEFIGLNYPQWTIQFTMQTICSLS